MQVSLLVKYFPYPFVQRDRWRTKSWITDIWKNVKDTGKFWKRLPKSKPPQCKSDEKVIMLQKMSYLLLNFVWLAILLSCNLFDQLSNKLVNDTVLSRRLCEHDKNFVESYYKTRTSKNFIFKKSVTEI